VRLLAAVDEIKIITYPFRLCSNSLAPLIQKDRWQP